MVSNLDDPDLYLNLDLKEAENGGVSINLFEIVVRLSVGNNRDLNGEHKGGWEQA